MKEELNLLDQIIEMEKHRDKQYKEMATLAHRGSQAIGESSIIFHLKTLRELLWKKSLTEVPLHILPESYITRFYSVKN